MFGWSYDYLLWGISWMNVELMMADMARTKPMPKAETDENGLPKPPKGGKIIRRELKTKEDIKNYVKGLI